MSIFINLAVIFWSLFPALLSYTDNQVDPLKVQLTQFVTNSDLLIDSNSDNIPDGFSLQGVATNLVLSNGVWSFDTDGGYRGIKYPNIGVVGNTFYFYAKAKSSLSGVNLYFDYANRVSIPTTSETSFVSLVAVPTIVHLYILDNRLDGSPIATTQVDYIGAINITDLVSRGMLPSGLTDNEYKTLIDNVLLDVGTFQGDYFYTETIADNYKWFSTGFVEKTGERDFIDYLGFFVWLVVPYLFVFLVYKLLKGVIYG